MVNEKKQRWSEGALVAIPISGNRYGFGKLLQSPLITFYHLESNELLEINIITSSPIAFKVWVMHSAITSGRWTIIGKVEISPEEKVSPWFFRQDAISQELTLIGNDDIEKPATAVECAGLECAQVWSAVHIESRLEDHFAGRRNKWIEEVEI